MAAATPSAPSETNPENAPGTPATEGEGTPDVGGAAKPPAGQSNTAVSVFRAMCFIIIVLTIATTSIVVLHLAGTLNFIPQLVA
ncbi:hypothetical protein Y032_0524g2920 [Ancylostoma ceylanicum]|uniref:Uncharacterized protein n=1 Tax=Ancylostoma ceylanicum TaxID=53326 RepID=A0A016WSK0_9BILA|nr:hypothetical protein Y032_0524g2920 [Ancylostoma ceylanicum]